MTISAKSFDRIRVLVIVFAGFALITLLWLALLTPFNNDRRELEKRIQDQKSQLEMKDFLRGPEVLQKELDRESRQSAALQTEWTNMLRIVRGFRDIDALRDADIGSIDYKIALIEGRERLRKKAQTLDINMQKDFLGIDMKVSSNEDARKLMLHLRAAETLVDLALDIKIKSIRFVEPMEHQAHRPQGFNDVFLEEYPVKIQFFASMENLQDFFESITKEDHYFALKQIRIEPSAPGKAELLNVTAVASALLFTRTPDQISGVVTEKKTMPKAVPQGH